MSGGPGWLGAIARLAHAVEGGVDAAKHAIGERIGDLRPPRVVAYRGFGTPREVWVTGRVLRDLPLPAARAEATVLENAIATFQRFESDEVAGAVVRLRTTTTERTVATDEEGFFECTLPTEGTAPLGEGWHSVEAELVQPRAQKESPTTLMPVLVVPDDAPLGIISDIDDTVVQTGATEILKMARSVFLGNARTRLPFEGVAELYAALRAGATGAAQNPVFYVSSSPWNLYELLVEFLEVQKIPLGPLMLRDWGLTAEELLPTGHASHKREAIERILTMYPARPFLLMGDSGQEDPEIYASVMHDFPDRIVGAYIRSAHPDPLRAKAVRDLAGETAKTGGVLVLADDSRSMMEDARKRGWIR